MTGILWIVASGTVLFAGVVSYVVARRYGWGTAVMLPVLSLVALIAMHWQDAGRTAAQGWAALGPEFLFAAPVLLGAVIGASLARIRR